MNLFLTLAYLLFIGFVLGWVFLNEQLGGRALVGFVLVLLSIIGVQRAMMPRTGRPLQPPGPKDSST